MLARSWQDFLVKMNGDHPMKCFAAFLLTTCFSMWHAPLIASEETMLEARTFAIDATSAKIGDVSVRGAARDFGISRLHVQAFGKRFVVPRNVLRQFDRIKVNGISLTLDGGVVEGDHDILVIILSSVYSAGMVDSGSISVRRSGRIEADFLRRED